MITLHWSRVPGRFVMKKTGESVSGIPFEGTVREWYETLVETIIDCVRELAQARDLLLHVDITVHPDVNCILQCSIRFHPAPPSSSIVGSFLHPTMDVREDPNQPRDVVKVVLRRGPLFEEVGAGAVKVLDMPKAPPPSAGYVPGILSGTFTVQPLSVPSSLVFYDKYIYGSGSQGQS
jgi:hypothetical protein